VQGALHDPNAYWPLNYEKPFDTKLGGITSAIAIAKVLSLRGAAHLDNHETELAEKDYLFSFDLERSIAKKPLLISDLVIAAVRAVSNSILWEGIHRHAWSPSQLQEMESALEGTDMLALGVKSHRLERANALQTMKVMEKLSSEEMGNLFLDFDPGLWRLMHLRPAGWWDQDRRELCLNVQNHIEAFHLKDGRFVKVPRPPTSDWFVDKIYTPISATFDSDTEGIDHKVVQAETNCRLARIACRLEEYYLENMQYPARLDELPDLPAHLNQEVLSPNPFHYTRKDDGYLLYSTGWDEKDHGGKPWGPLPSHDEWDWVWPSP
jgi:hypothetical protein